MCRLGTGLKPSCWPPSNAGYPSCSFKNIILGVLEFISLFSFILCLCGFFRAWGELFKSTWNYFCHIVLLILSDKAYQILQCTWRVCKRLSGRRGVNCTILAGRFKSSRDSPSLEALKQQETGRDSIRF